MQQNDKLNILAADAAQALIPTFNANLRIAADAGGWPDDIAAQLTVIYVDGSLIISYPSEIETIVNDLEYGSVGVPPKPVLRNFSYRINDALKVVLTNRTTDLLCQLEGVF